VKSQGGKNQKMRKLLKSKKALSPVVAAIILIAVTVAVSIAVAAWMGSMTFQFMETEQLQITSVTFDTAVDGGIIASVRNTGTTDVIIISAKVTGNGVTSTADLAADVTIPAGGVAPVPAGIIGQMSAGTAYNVELLSSKGNKFSYTETA
jgi:flagellin-like protein